MKNPTSFALLFAALVGAHAPADPLPTLPEAEPFRLIPASATKAVLVYDGCHGIIGALGNEWKGSTLYVDSWPVEFESPRISLAQPYTFSAEAFEQRIRFLYTRAAIHEETSPNPPSQPGNGKFNFNIGYQF